MAVFGAMHPSLYYPPPFALPSRSQLFAALSASQFVVFCHVIPPICEWNPECEPTRPSLHTGTPQEENMNPSSVPSPKVAPGVVWSLRQVCLLLSYPPPGWTAR